MKTTFTSMALGLAPMEPPRPMSCWADIKDALHAAQVRRNQPMTEDDFGNMAMYYRLAYENIMRGSASRESWGMLALASNLALKLGEMGYDEQHLDGIELAQEALLRAEVRGNRNDCFRLDGDGARQVAWMLDVFDGQLQAATRADIIFARDVVQQELVKQNVKTL